MRGTSRAGAAASDSADVQRHDAGVQGNRSTARCGKSGWQADDQCEDRSGSESITEPQGVDARASAPAGERLDDLVARVAAGSDEVRYPMVREVCAEVGISVDDFENRVAARRAELARMASEKTDAQIADQERQAVRIREDAERKAAEMEAAARAEREQARGAALAAEIGVGKSAEDLRVHERALEAALRDLSERHGAARARIRTVTKELQDTADALDRERRATLSALSTLRARMRTLGVECDLDRQLQETARKQAAEIAARDQAHRLAREENQVQVVPGLTVRDDRKVKE